MKTKVTKQVKKELKNIIDATGYWSNETRIFLEQFEYTTRIKLNNLAQVYYKYPNMSELGRI